MRFLFLGGEGDADEAWAFFQPVERAVVIAAAIAEAGAALVEAEQRHDDQIGLDMRGEFGRGEGAEAGLVQRRALFPQPQFERLFIAEDDGQADRLERIHQADEDGLAVHLVLDAPIAGDDVGGLQRHGVEEVFGHRPGGIGTTGIEDRGAAATGLCPERSLCFFDLGIQKPLQK